MNDLKLQKANEEKLARQALENAQKLQGELDGRQIQVSVKAGEGGKVFGSVSSKEIAEEVKNQLGLEIDKKKIQLDTTIKSLGVTRVPIKLHPKVTAEILVNVTEK